MQPDLIKYYDLILWVESDLEVSLKRAKDRDVNEKGNDEKHHEEFWAKWIPVQEKYINLSRPKEHADIVISTVNGDFEIISENENDKDVIQTIAIQINNLTKEKANKPLIIAIDGRSGGGKSTLTTKLQKLIPNSKRFNLDAYTIRSGDFFAKELIEVGYEVDFENTEYDIKRIQQEISESNYNVIFLEGAFSFQNLGDIPIDLKILVELDAATAADRLNNRETREHPELDPKIVELSTQKWQEAEERYRTNFKPLEKADIVISTEDGAFEIITEDRNAGNEAKTIKYILFDIDGVLNENNLASSGENWLDKVANKYKIDSTKIQEFFEHTSFEAWIGKTDLIEDLEPFLVQSGWPGTSLEFLQSWFEVDLAPIKETLELAHKLKAQGYKLAVATQQEKYRTEFLINNLLPAGLFEQLFVTHEIGFFKKDIQFWEQVVQKLGTSPSEILMIDDTHKVLDYAKLVGLKALHYRHGFTDLLLELNKILEPNANYTGRQIVGSGTKNPSDFVLWKFVDPKSLQKWKFDDYQEARKVLDEIAVSNNSVENIGLGQIWGCPGWHSECVAMISQILGKKRFSFADSIQPNSDSKSFEIDLHTGGEDHIDVHHKNEILQSEALEFHLSSGWVHNKFVTVDGRKMGKSLGNSYLITGNRSETGSWSLANPPVKEFDSAFQEQIIKKYKELKLPTENLDQFWESFKFDPLAYRLMMFEHHYSEQMNFTWSKLWQSQMRLWGLRKEAAKLQSLITKGAIETASFDKVDQSQTRGKLLNILTNNLNFSEFLEKYSSLLVETVKQANQNPVLPLPDSNKDMLIGFDFKILQLDLFIMTKIPEEVEILVEQRQKFKEAKDWTEADEIRTRIQNLGWQIDDYSWGWGVWRR